MKLVPGDGPYGFSKREWRTLVGLRTPKGIQRLLDTLRYHDADTAWSPRRVLQEGTAHCLEGAILAAAALRASGHPPLIFDLEATRDCDHVIAVYRVGGYWGSIAMSHFTGLRDRMPVYKTLRELAMSYFDDYFNLLGERTLRSFAGPLNLVRFDRRNWMTSQRPVWFIVEHLIAMRHQKLLPRRQIKHLYRVDGLGVDAGLLGYRKPRKVNLSLK